MLNVSVKNVYYDTNTLLNNRSVVLVCIFAAVEFLGTLRRRGMDGVSKILQTSAVDWILVLFDPPAAFCDDSDRPLVLVQQI